MAVVSAASCSRLMPLTSASFFGGVADEGGFVGLAAMGDGREIGGVGLDEVAIGRNVGGDGANFLGISEGYDAREGNVSPQGQGAGGEVAAGGEAVENEGEGPLPGFFLEDGGHVVVGGAAVDNQWKTGDAGGGDVAAETGRLRLARGVVVEVVEARFADGNATGMGT